MLEIYASHLDEMKQDKYKLTPALSLFLPLDLGIPSDELLKLTNRETGKKIPVDKRQKEVLDGIVERVRDDGFIPNCTLKLFYPFKSNAFNNNARMTVLSIYIKDLIDYHYCNNEEFYEKCRFEKYHALSDCTKPKDTLSVFMANMLFIICANFKIEDIQECMDKIRPSVNMARIRNAIVHGTFFHDKDMGLHFYDDKSKEEDDLKYVGNLDFVEITILKDLLIKHQLAKSKQDQSPSVDKSSELGD